VSGTVLPDGIFSNQRSQFLQVLECLAIRNVGTFCDHLVNFPAICPYGIFCGHLVNFPNFGMLFKDKSGNLGPALFSGSLIASQMSSQTLRKVNGNGLPNYLFKNVIFCSFCKSAGTFTL
jgi:hypothetical protein